MLWPRLFAVFLFLPRCFFSSNSLRVLTYSFNNSDGNCSALDIFDNKGSVLDQIQAHSLLCNFTEQRRIELFTEIVEENTRIFLQFSIPLQEEKIIIRRKVKTLKLTISGGPLLSQIKRFCRINNCDQVNLNEVISIFKHRYRFYWFPKLAILLETWHISHNSTADLSKANVIPLVTDIKTYVIRSKSRSNYSSRSANRSPRVFYTMFAGRKEFLAIHLIYTDLLLATKLVTEVHIWDFAPVAMSYDIGSFVRATPREGYRLFRRPLRDTKYIGKLNEGYKFQSYYAHYGTNKRYRPSDVIVKADDDIVFLDISQFSNYVSNVGYTSFHFPNIVNNDVTFVIQAKRRVHPLLPRLLEAYELSGRDLYHHIDSFITTKGNASALSIYSICPVTTLYCVDGEGGNQWGGLFESGRIASILHNVFIQDPGGFIARSASGPKYVTAARRVSLNMFAAKISLFQRVFSDFLTADNCCDDEGYLGKWPSMSRQKHVVDTQFTVVHFAFGPQRKHYLGNMTSDLMRYEALGRAINEAAFTWPFSIK